MKDRRTFLKSLSALTSGLLVSPVDAIGASNFQDKWGELLPQRRLGKTGETVTMLGVGGSHVGRADEKRAQEIIECAMAGGVRFFDNAESYQGGRAEEFYGKFLVPKYRDECFIMTKSTAKTVEMLKEHLEGSLRRMQCDVIDLYQIHSLKSPQDVDERLANGVLEFVLKARQEGKVRHIGFTGHAQYQAHQHMLASQTELQTCQMPINVFDPSYKSFINSLMPELIKQDYGVIAMKTLSNGGFFGGSTFFEHGDEPRIIPDRISMREAMHFVWSLPVSVLVTGADDAPMLQEKIDLAKSYVSMEEDHRSALIAKVAELDGSKVEYYKS